MPIPKRNESRNDFVQRCVKINIEEGKSVEQSVAICNSIYDKK